MEDTKEKLASRRQSIERSMTETVTCSGTYRYRWSTWIGNHSVFFRVVDGIIQENPASITSPIKSFEGRTVMDISMGRLAKDWPFQDDSLHQITA